MKLIFNKENNGTDELKELLGYIDADLKFENLEPDLNTATNDVVKIIGKEVYQIILTAYTENSTSDYKKALIKAIRYPIAVNAYRLFAPSNDLSHTNNGRKMRSDDGEKSAFEWMIDRDNAAQEVRYYRALDDMIIFLDEARDYSVPESAPDTDLVFEKSIYDAWTGSDAFKETNNLFIRTVDDFDRVFPIKSRLLLLMLTPGLSDCETYDIIPRVRFSKFEELKNKLKSRSLIDDPKDLQLVKLIKTATAFSALAWSMPRFSVRLFPEGVLQHYTSDRATTRGAKPTLNMESEAAAKAFRDDAQKALLQIEKLLTPQPTPEQIATISIDPEIISGDKFFSI
jgi:hypothetical protein